MLAAIAALIALAQPSPRPPAPLPPPAVRTAPVDPARVAEAIRLLDAEGFEEQSLRSADMALELMLASVTEQIQKRTSAPVPEDFLEKWQQTMRDHMNKTMRANMASAKREAAEIYAQEFSREELARLSELAADPVMIKARARNKVMGPKLMMIGVRRMRDAEPELQAKIQQLVADYLRTQGKDAPDRS
jgi:hypothetical protein